MSIFASREQRTIPIPFDPPHEVTIQKLSGKNLERASKAFIAELIGDVQKQGGSRVMKDMQSLWDKDKPEGENAETLASEEVEKVKKDPLNGYDKHVLMYMGILRWSYPDSLEKVPTQEENAGGQRVTVLRVPAIDDLDDQAVTFFATEILKLTKPSLFLTPVEQKEAQVKG